MNYYSLILCFVASFFGNETKQFVEFKEATTIVVKENGHVKMILPFEVLTDYHIQSNSEVSDGSIPTEITFKGSDDYKIISQEFSLVQNETIVLNRDKHKVISNRFEVTVTLKLNKNITNSKLVGGLYYQACTDRQCLFPRTLDFQISL